MDLFTQQYNCYYCAHHYKEKSKAKKCRILKSDSTHHLIEFESGTVIATPHNAISKALEY